MTNLIPIIDINNVFISDGEMSHPEQIIDLFVRYKDSESRPTFFLHNLRLFRMNYQTCQASFVGPYDVFTLNKERMQHESHVHA